MTIRGDEVRDLEARHVLQVYRRAPVVIVRGDGARLYDADDIEYLDLISGVGVASLGHANPRLAAALAEQARTLVHTSNLFYHPLQGQVAERLAALSGLSRAFFCNSGTEAIEACLKFARRYWHTRGEPGRRQFVALTHSFHGRTFGSLSVTWDEHYRAPFVPLLADVAFVAPTDPAALAAAATDTTAAIVVEALQGEGGVRPLSPAFVGAAQAACARTGALLIADEVQCGLGRTGHAFHYQALGLQPDLVAVGKALGAGMPVGAALASEAVAGTLAYGDHGSTYGGNLLACRAALVYLDELTGGLLDRVRRTGAHLERGLRRLAGRHAAIVEVRGSGLMWGVEMAGDAAPIVDLARQRRLLINRTAERVVRLLPPLTIAEAELDRALDILDSVLTDVPVGATTR